MEINGKNYRAVKNDERNRRGDVDREGYPIDSSRYGCKQKGFSNAYRLVPKKKPGRKAGKTHQSTSAKTGVRAAI
jgi:hypothetical protein